MQQSIFINKADLPDETALSNALGKNFSIWQELKDYIAGFSSNIKEEWHFSKSGWNARLVDKKRVIIYLMPGECTFQVSLVLGQKATTDLLAGKLSTEVRTIVESARVYAEGRGIRLEVRNKHIIPDIKRLIEVKFKY